MQKIVFLLFITAVSSGHYECPGCEGEACLNGKIEQQVCRQPIAAPIGDEDYLSFGCLSLDYTIRGLQYLRKECAILTGLDLCGFYTDIFGEDNLKKCEIVPALLVDNELLRVRRDLDESQSDVNPKDNKDPNTSENPNNPNTGGPADPTGPKNQEATTNSEDSTTSELPTDTGTPTPTPTATTTKKANNSSTEIKPILLGIFILVLLLQLT